MTFKFLILCSLILLFNICLTTVAQVGKKGEERPPSSSTKSSSDSKKKANSTSNSRTGRQSSNRRTDSAPSKSIEQTYWESIRDSSNPEDFRAYLQKYPNGEFIDIARNRINSLETAERERKAAEAMKAETAYWESIKESTKIEDYRTYLSRYPSGQYMALAKNKIDTFYNQVFSQKAVDQKARIISRPPPVYTEEARKNQVNGVVRLRLIFKADGTVTNITAVAGLPDGLTERAIAAAKMIKFEPAMKDGRKVSTYMTIEYNFNLY